MKIRNTYIIAVNRRNGPDSYVQHVKVYTTEDDSAYVEERGTIRKVGEDQYNTYEDNQILGKLIASAQPLQKG